MGRAFGELDPAFYESGGVLSQRTSDARIVRKPVVERSDRNVAVTGKFTETHSLGVPECIDLGGYYTFDLGSD